MVKNHYLRRKRLYFDGKGRRTSPGPCPAVYDWMSVLADFPTTPRRTIAVAGSSGYVGGRLVPALLQAGHRVRCIARDARKLRDRPWSDAPNLSLVECSLEDRDAVTAALAGCDAAYYLVHTMVSAGSSFAERDTELARHFGEAAARARAGRIIYLGGLGEMGESLSEHLVSRRQVEAALRSGGVPVTTLRAAMIIGSGSASFEILRYLVERLPIMVTPRWVRTESQPIAIRDVIRYLLQCLDTPATIDRDLDIGGADTVTYEQLMRIMQEALGLRRRLVIPVAVLSPGLSSRWIHLVTPIDARLARPLAEGLRNRTVCRNDDAHRLMPGELLTARQAVAKALEAHRASEVPTSWSDAGAMPRQWAPAAPMQGDPSWSGGTLFVDRRERLVHAAPEELFQTLRAIGGRNGYFSANALWRLRGAIDRLLGGPGLRRGRRDASIARLGDAIDFWRVTAIEPSRRLELTAEMRLPGHATLEWRIDPRPDGRSLLTQTARFRPRGLLGLAYWWSVWPVHGPVFRGMLRGVSERAEETAARLTARSSGGRRARRSSRARARGPAP